MRVLVRYTIHTTKRKLKGVLLWEGDLPGVPRVGEAFGIRGVEGEDPSYYKTYTVVDVAWLADANDPSYNAVLLAVRGQE